MLHASTPRLQLQCKQCKCVNNVQRCLILFAVEAFGRSASTVRQFRTVGVGDGTLGKWWKKDLMDKKGRHYIACLCHEPVLKKLSSSTSSRHFALCKSQVEVQAFEDTRSCEYEDSHKARLIALSQSFNALNMMRAPTRQCLMY